jgi:hypothetical protein
MQHKNQPAFPPQVMQDSLGRIIAPVPGMTKLEFLSSLLLPVLMKIERETDGLRIDGKIVNPYEMAIFMANKHLEKVKRFEDETDSTNNLQLV